jgi:hypothetical protein
MSVMKTIILAATRMDQPEISKLLCGCGSHRPRVPLCFGRGLPHPQHTSVMAPRPETLTQWQDINDHVTKEVAKEKGCRIASASFFIQCNSQ